MKYQSITDYLLAHGYVINEDEGFLCGQLLTVSFGWIAEMSNKHTVEEFAEIAQEKGWVTETKPVVVPKPKVEEKKEKKPTITYYLTEKGFRWNETADVFVRNPQQSYTCAKLKLMERLVKREDFIRWAEEGNWFPAKAKVDIIWEDRDGALIAHSAPDSTD